MAQVPLQQARNELVVKELSGYNRMIAGLCKWTLIFGGWKQVHLIKKRIAMIR